MPGPYNQIVSWGEVSIPGTTLIRYFPKPIPTGVNLPSTLHFFQFVYPTDHSLIIMSSVSHPCHSFMGTADSRTFVSTGFKLDCTRKSIFYNFWTLHNSIVVITFSRAYRCVFINHNWFDYYIIWWLTMVKIFLYMYFIFLYPVWPIAIGHIIYTYHNNQYL